MLMYKTPTFCKVALTKKDTSTNYKFHGPIMSFIWRFQSHIPVMYLGVLIKAMREKE